MNRRCTASESGFTLVELLIVISIVGILSALAIAGYKHVKISGAEASALASLRAINDAQVVFAQTCGNQQFSSTLAGLGTPAPSTGQAFLSPDLTTDPVLKSGYQIVMTATPALDARQTCNGVAPAATYRVTADPVNPGLSGIRYFGTNGDRVLYADTASYSQDMPQQGAPGHGSEIK